MGDCIVKGPTVPSLQLMEIAGLTRVAFNRGWLLIHWGCNRFHFLSGSLDLSAHFVLNS